MVPHQILHARQILRAPGQALVNEQAPERWRLMSFMRHLRIRPAWITWWKRARRLIRCTIVPLIHRQARINHANPRFATSRGQAASKGLTMQVLAIAGVSWPVEPGSAS
jgi:hypothetical protein